jgi:hypothetical protein
MPSSMASLKSPLKPLAASKALWRCGAIGRRADNQRTQAISTGFRGCGRNSGVAERRSGYGGKTGYRCSRHAVARGFDGGHAPVVSDEPKEEMAGGVAPEGICGGSIPVIGSALLAPTVPPGAAAPFLWLSHMS